MKYLKSINENFSIGDSESLEEIQSIKDVFQDIVDEFNMEETDELHELHQEGLYYYFTPSYNGDHLLLFIFAENREVEFEKLFNRLVEFKERLSNMGYKLTSDDAQKPELKFEQELSDLRMYGNFLIHIILLN